MDLQACVSQPGQGHLLGPVPGAAASEAGRPGRRSADEEVRRE